MRQLRGLGLSLLFGLVLLIPSSPVGAQLLDFDEQGASRPRFYRSSSIADPSDLERSVSEHELRQWRLPKGGFYTPVGIDVADDDTIWFADVNQGQVGRVAPDGTAAEFELPGRVVAPTDIAAAADGSAWVIALSDHLVHIQSGGTMEVFRLPHREFISQLDHVVIGPEGDPWFTSSGDTLYRLHDGVFDEVLPMPGGELTVDITLGPDDRIWVAGWVEIDTPGRLIRVRSDGTYKSFKIPEAPEAITSGPNGRIWFTMWNQTSSPESTFVGRMSTDGNLGPVVTIERTQFPDEITRGSDGNVWISVRTMRDGKRVDGVGRVTPEGRVRLFESPYGSLPIEFARMSDGTFVFSDFLAHVGTLTTTGAFGDISLERFAFTPYDITTGADGAMWFTETYSDQLGRLDPNGTITHVQFPSGSHPIGIASGPDGNLWVTLAYANQIARVTLNGSVTTFDIPTPYAYPYFIEEGPDGKMWFVEQMRRPKSSSLADPGSAIGRIRMDGTITEFSVSEKKNHLLTFISPGPDGAMWFTGAAGFFKQRLCFPDGTCELFPDQDLGSSLVGRIFPNGDVDTWKVPGSPTGIAAGPDGHMWFADQGDPSPDIDFIPGRGRTSGEPVPPSIGRVGLDGAFSSYPLPKQSLPWDVTFGDRDALFFTDEDPVPGDDEPVYRIGRVRQGGAVSWKELPLELALPQGITTSPDGAVWFTEPRDTPDPAIPVQSFIARLVPLRFQD